MNYCFFGHHKCGSTWFRRISENVCKSLALSYAYEHNSMNIRPNISSFFSKNEIDFLVFANADKNFIDDDAQFRAFHVIRDPRDLVVSGYYSHLYSHTLKGSPELREHRDQLKSVEQDEGLFKEMLFDAKFLGHMYNWNYKDERILELKYEDVLRDSSLIFKAYENLGLVNQPVRGRARRWIFKNYKTRVMSSARMNRIIESHSFKAISKRNVGEENVKSHFRKGISGDWKNHFNEEHKEYFKKEFGEVLIKLGYEKDSSW